MKKIGMMLIAAVTVLVTGGCSNEPPLVEKAPVDNSVQGLE